MTERVRLLFGSFRAQGAVDAATFTVAVASVLLEYPEDIIVDVTDPARGLPAKIEWLSVKAVRDECERLKAVRYPPAPRPRQIEREISDEERERVARKFRDLADSLGAPERVIIEDPVKAAEARLEAAKINGWSGKLSDEALSKFHRDAQDRGWAA